MSKELPKAKPGQFIVTGETKQPKDERVVVDLTEWSRVNTVNSIIKAISQKEIFQRGGFLVRITRAPELGEGGFFLPIGEPAIRPAPATHVMELAVGACKFVQRKRSEHGGGFFVKKEVEVPSVVIRTLTERGEWSWIRPIEGLISWPVLRPNGTLFQGVGYDVGTRYYATENLGITLPKRIGKPEVQAAVGVLHDLVAEFPFETAAHESAWLSALLSVLARPAIDGPVPMLVVDANDRGAGKTLLCDLIGAILSGRRLPRRPMPADDSEWGKTMLGIARASYPVVLLDNVTGTLRSTVLDMVLTGDEFSQRLLGENEDLKLKLRSVFLVSSNNATVSTDLVRRSLHCRVVVPIERPENRGGFRYRLPEDAQMRPMRRKLLAAAMTILVGYQRAGRPPVDIRPLGSYQGWSDRVQSAIVWAGLPDPATTQDEFRKQADPDNDTHLPVLEAWYRVFKSSPQMMGKTLSFLREDVQRENPTPGTRDLLDQLELLGDAGAPVTAARVGQKLRYWRDKWSGGKCFASAPMYEGARRWYVKLDPHWVA